MGAVELLLGLVAAGLVVVAVKIVAHQGAEDIRRSLDDSYRDGSND